MEDLRKVFHKELDEIRDDIVRMAALVTECIPRGTEAFLDMDLVAAQRLIDDDDILDELSVDFEERCYQLVARQAPMASDLRAIMAALTMNSEIERSGDLVVNIAKATRRVYGSTFDPRLRGMLQEMSGEAQRLFRFAIDAYVEGDVGLAAALDDIDDRLDELNHEVVGLIFAAHTAGDIDLQAAVQLALIARYYERIGDHAVNIGERVRYMVTGWLKENTGASRAKVARTHSPLGAAVADGPFADDSPLDAAGGGDESP
ncbi:MAG: phosphate signaling complex protein PhoU [Acidimicrobiales bacterium]